jgi:hypothetical protein
LKFLKEAMKDFEKAEFEKMTKTIIECLKNLEPDLIKKIKAEI